MPSLSLLVFCDITESPSTFSSKRATGAIFSVVTFDKRTTPYSFSLLCESRSIFKPNGITLRPESGA
ncbi:Uncharacterised protein [Vibrio cholerae]|nr:Uncharacterised protein [Vibrio cholerae]CSI48662.1 Uncharacterised protein [Vibrio cholerae]